MVDFLVDLYYNNLGNDTDKDTGKGTESVVGHIS